MHVPKQKCCGHDFLALCSPCTYSTYPTQKNHTPGGRLFDEAGGAVRPQALVGDRDAPAGPDRETVSREVRSQRDLYRGAKERGGREDGHVFSFSGVVLSALLFVGLTEGKGQGKGKREYSDVPSQSQPHVFVLTHRGEKEWKCTPFRVDRSEARAAAAAAGQVGTTHHPPLLCL